MRPLHSRSRNEKTINPSDWGEEYGGPSEPERRKRNPTGEGAFRSLEDEVGDAVDEGRPPDDGVSQPED